MARSCFVCVVISAKAHPHIRRLRALGFIIACECMESYWDSRSVLALDMRMRTHTCKVTH
jgi:hypothetical protein